MIGGGAVGASAAWHLRELGIEDVLLVERDSLGSGSTSKSAGGVRMQFADELNVRIAQRSLAELERMDGIDLRRAGYLFLLDREEDLAEFRAALALQAAARRPLARAVGRRGARARAAARAGGAARRDVLPARRPLHARGGRAVVRAGAATCSRAAR